MATGKPFFKTLIEYNNSLEESDEEENWLINIEFTEQKADPEMMKMLLTLNDQMYKKKTKESLPWQTSLKITKASWWGKVSKK